ncbi:MAG: type II toxin-antitoxin system VapC family toxin [Spirochaetes bacterium]|nr:type II toxin-antitoxin system VapC family toxin [Spirochaetota bacterium]
MILLDTDVCIEILRGNRNVIEKRKTESDVVAVSFITVAELFYGSLKSVNSTKNNILVEKFLLSIDIIQSDYEISKKFGELKANLEINGNVIADADLFIASTAITKCSKLITGNVKHFDRITNLHVENWIRN